MGFLPTFDASSVRQGAVAVCAAFGVLALRRYGHRPRRVHAVVAQYPAVVAWNPCIAQSMSSLAAILNDEAQTHMFMRQLESLRRLDERGTHVAQRDLTREIAALESALKHATKLSTDMSHETMNDYVYANDDLVPSICTQLTDVVLHNHLLRHSP